MNENIDFIVLEHDDGAGCALIAATVEGAVPAIDGYNTPYVVAEGYDHAARDWEDCRLFDDIGKAKLAYEKLRGRDYSLDADMPDSIAFRAKHSDRHRRLPRKGLLQERLPADRRQLYGDRLALRGPQPRLSRRGGQGKRALRAALSGVGARRARFARAFP